MVRFESIDGCVETAGKRGFFEFPPPPPFRALDIFDKIEIFYTGF